jgi:hypothetical protein
VPPKSKIGQYRHTPGVELQPGPDGVLRPARRRRRFPFYGIVFFAYGLLGPLACAGVSLLFRATGSAQLLPQRLSDLPIPPSPSMDNLLFGAGFHETVLACGLVGWWLWRALWNVRVTEDQRQRGIAGVLPSLMGLGLVMGPVLAFAALPLGAIGLYLRTAPANQPWPVRLLFSIPAALIVTPSALLTGIIPLVLLLLGLLLGAATALAVAALWQHFPEEPVLK